MISIIENNRDSDLVFHILCENIANASKDKLARLQKMGGARGTVSVKFYDINEEDFQEYAGMPTYPGITLPTYFRLHLPSILSNVQKALYLDGDTIVCGALNQLFQTDMSNYCIAGVPDINCHSFEQIHTKYQLNDNTYINAGVCLFNLEKMRIEQAERAIDQFVQTHYDDIKFGDQDILNLVFENQIGKLPAIYNVHGTSYFNRNTYKKPVIIHHVCKAWNFGTKSYYQDEYFKYLRLSDWAFESQVEEYKYRVASNIVALKNLIGHPKTIFSKDFIYEIYRCTIRRLTRRE
jgi:lipopolysaccharide biosynthesis glycosyltransferase